MTLLVVYGPWPLALQMRWQRELRIVAACLLGQAKIWLLYEKTKP
jgi:hypothetical protein